MELRHQNKLISFDPITNDLTIDDNTASLNEWIFDNQSLGIPTLAYEVLDGWDIEQLLEFLIAELDSYVDWS